MQDETRRVNLRVEHLDAPDHNQQPAPYHNRTCTRILGSVVRSGVEQASKTRCGGGDNLPIRATNLKPPFKCVYLRLHVATRVT